MKVKLIPALFATIMLLQFVAVAQDTLTLKLNTSEADQDGYVTVGVTMENIASTLSQSVSYRGISSFNFTIAFDEARYEVATFDGGTYFEFLPDSYVTADTFFGNQPDLPQSRYDDDAKLYRVRYTNGSGGEMLKSDNDAPIELFRIKLRNVIGSQETPLSAIAFGGVRSVVLRDNQSGTTAVKNVLFFDSGAITVKQGDNVRSVIDPQIGTQIIQNPTTPKVGDTMYIAAYRAGAKLLSLDSLSSDQGVEMQYAADSFAGAEYLKIFVWNDTLEPSFAPIEMPVVAQAEKTGS